MRNKKNIVSGFTLLEILVALFIFTIVSGLLASALHNIIGIEERTNQHAERLHELQRALLIVASDIEQAVDRPVLNAIGKEEVAFIGSPTQFTLTHTGIANGYGSSAQSTMQRNSFTSFNHQLVRLTYSVLDQASSTAPHPRVLLNQADARFEYLDKDGRFHQYWPVEGKKEEKLPRAVRIYITMPDWGKMSQLYLTGA